MDFLGGPLVYGSSSSIYNSRSHWYRRTPPRRPRLFSGRWVFPPLVARTSTTPTSWWAQRNLFMSRKRYLLLLNNKKNDAWGVDRQQEPTPTVTRDTY